MALTKVSRGLLSTSIEDNGNATAITIDSSENVGIGTSSPNQLLEVASSSGGATVSISTDEAAGSSSSKKYMNLDFTGWNNNVMARIQSWDESSSTGNGYLTLHTTPAGGSVTERMRIDASGRVTMPYQPAFDARSNSSTMQVTSGVVPYSIATVNVGSGYNTSTHRFTAPVAGQYLISWYGILGDQNTNGVVSLTTLHIRKNGSQIVNCHSNNNDYWEQASCTTVVSLAVNDYVDVYLNSGGVYYGDSTNQYSKFCGYLIG